MLIHDFYVIKKNKLDFDKLKIGIIEKKDVLAELKISDDYILKNHYVFLGENASFSSSFLIQLDHRIKKGLCYYGITVMQEKDINEFLISLEQLPDSKEKLMIDKICRFAIKNRCCLVHVGV